MDAISVFKNEKAERQGLHKNEQMNIMILFIICAQTISPDRPI
jgi:hypothetical protein